MPSSPDFPTPERNSYHHGDLRAALIAAGTTLLERDGLEAFSLRSAAREVGVSPSAPYKHFPDRSALLRAIAATGYRRLATELSDASLTAPKAARHLARFAGQHPGSWEVMVGEQSEAEGELEEARAELLAELVGAVERDQRKKDPEAAIRKAVAIWAVVVGTARLKADGAFGLLEEWMVPSAGAVAETILSGRLPRPLLARRP